MAPISPKSIGVAIRIRLRTRASSWPAAYSAAITPPRQ